jgi:hypothetical protein
MMSKEIEFRDGALHLTTWVGHGRAFAATLMWCSDHYEPVWVYSDGSYGCPYDQVVGCDTHHTIVNFPTDPARTRVESQHD